MRSRQKISIMIVMTMVLQFMFPIWGGHDIAKAKTSGPEYLSLSPANSTSNVPIRPKLMITFDENIVKGDPTKKISIHNHSDYNDSVSYNVSASNITIQDNVMTIAVNSGLALATDYYVQIEAGAVANAGNGALFAGISGANNWSFRTIENTDTQRPEVLTASPSLCEGTSGVCNIELPVTTNTFSFTFNEPVFIADSYITLSGGTDRREISVTSKEVEKPNANTITIRLSEPLRPSTTYSIMMNGQNIEDASGNRFLEKTWRFKTPADAVGVPLLSPATGAAGVATNGELVLTFEQNVQAIASKKIQIRRTSDNLAVFDQSATSSYVRIDSTDRRKVTIKPTTALSANTAYYVTIEAGAFVLASNTSQIFSGFNTATDWRFTTGYGTDNRPPSISKYSPTKNNTKVNSNEKIILTFDEPVYPSRGTIEIREANSKALYRSIDVPSVRVTGGGTNVITIDPHRSLSSESAKSFTKNTKYYVTISNQAFTDQAGNYFGGVVAPSSSNSYSFQVAAADSFPQLVSLTPVNGSTTVSVSSKIKATFDKAVTVNPNSNIATFYPVGNSSTPGIVTGEIKSVSNDSKSVEIDLKETSPAIFNATDYYVNIPANAIQDANGNYFVGILNQYQWTFKTIGADRTAPTIDKTEVSGTTVRIVYNELLNEHLANKPSPASFYAVVAGNARNINRVEIEGNVVTLTLASAVKSGEQVTLSYTKPATGLIQDLSGNEAVSFASRAVINGFASTTPSITASTNSGSTVSLTFSESLAALNKLAYTQFSVSVDGMVYPIDKLTHSDKRLTFTLTRNIPTNAAVIVSYSSGLYPLKGLTNNTVASFSHRVGTATGTGGGTNTTGAPLIRSIASSGNTLTLQYDEALVTSSAPGAFQYYVQINNRSASVSSVRVSGDKVTLTMSQSMLSSDDIKVTYYGSNSTLLDSDNNPAASFTNMTANTVTDSESGTVAVLQGAILKGDTLTLSFSANLDSGSIPETSSFLLYVNENMRAISTVDISGSKLTMKLTSTARTGDKAAVSYFNTSSSLRSAGGVAINGFTNFTVANQTTVIDSLSDAYESDYYGVVMKVATSTQSSDTSPSGKSANRYTIKAEDLTLAVNALADAGIKDFRVTFEVPSNEASAIVALPIHALQLAKSKGNATILIRYQDMEYEIPLNAIDLTKAANQAGGSSTTNNLVVILEKGQTNLTNSLVTSINRSAARMIEGPYYFGLNIANSNRSEALTAYVSGGSNVRGIVGSNQAITASRTTAVRYDDIAGALSSVPTTFDIATDAADADIIFLPKANSAYAIVHSEQTFQDTVNHWANSTILIMARKFVVEGHSSTKFAPQASITRAEFATYIAKGLGLSANKEAARKFTDVSSNSAMGGYIGAAAASGIVAGVSNTKFDPNSSITRQDMAIMMIRAANYAGLSTSLDQSADLFLRGYNDQSSVSNYARTAMAQAVQTGIISGTTTTTLSPMKNATRAEGTIMIMRLLERADYLQK